MMANEPFSVIIATDASQDTHCSGLAYCIQDENGRTYHAWQVKKRIKTSTAEWWALKAALDVLAKRQYPPHTKLIYYGDNSFVVDLMRTGSSPFIGSFGRTWQPKVDWLKQVLSRFAEVEAHKVKAHSGEKGSEYYLLNRWCDLNARAMLRHGRRYIKRRSDE